MSTTQSEIYMANYYKEKIKGNPEKYSKRKAYNNAWNNTEQGKAYKREYAKQYALRKKLEKEFHNS